MKLITLQLQAILTLFLSTFVQKQIFVFLTIQNQLYKKNNFLRFKFQRLFKYFYLNLCVLKYKFLKLKESQRITYIRHIQYKYNFLHERLNNRREILRLKIHSRNFSMQKNHKRRRRKPSNLLALYLTKRVKVSFQVFFFEICQNKLIQDRFFKNKLPVIERSPFIDFKKSQFKQSQQVYSKLIQTKYNMKQITLFDLKNYKKFFYWMCIQYDKQLLKSQECAVKPQKIGIKVGQKPGWKINTIVLVSLGFNCILLFVSYIQAQQRIFAKNRNKSLIIYPGFRFKKMNEKKKIIVYELPLRLYKKFIRRLVFRVKKYRTQIRPVFTERIRVPKQTRLEKKRQCIFKFILKKYYKISSNFFLIEKKTKLQILTINPPAKLFVFLNVLMRQRKTYFYCYYKLFYQVTKTNFLANFYYNVITSDYNKFPMIRDWAFLIIYSLTTRNILRFSTYVQYFIDHSYLQGKTLKFIWQLIHEFNNTFHLLKRARIHRIGVIDKHRRTKSLNLQFGPCKISSFYNLHQICYQKVHIASFFGAFSIRFWFYF